MSGLGLEGTIALVTGGSGGLGAAACRALAAEGTAVVVHYSGAREAAEQVVAEIVAAGGRATAAQADVSDPADVERLMRAVVAFAGEERLDILYNNAGIFPTAAFEELTLEQWTRVLDVNLTGPFLCARAALPLLRASGRGRIINISSNTVFRGAPRTTAYISSKAGVIGLTRALAKELGDDGITVNCVVPSLVPTDSAVETFGPAFEMVKAAQAIHRLQTPEELADLVVFLASTRAGFVTGQTISVDGGLVLR